MSSFTVTPESLEALQHAVLGLAAELDNGPSATAGYEGTMRLLPGMGQGTDGYDIAGGQINGAELYLDPFFGRWRSSLGEIGENMVNVAQALGNAAERYAEVDDHVCLVNP
jgi:hypothetical protein